MTGVPDLRWESLACVLDETLGVPYAWGIASALRNAPQLLLRMDAARFSGASVAAYACGAWAVRAVADALFVPVDECAALSARAAGGASGEQIPLAEVVACARGASLMALIHSDRYALGLMLDEAAAAASELAEEGVLGGRLPMRAVKVAIAMSAPGDGTLAFFVGMQVESAWEWITRELAL